MESATNSSSLNTPVVSSSAAQRHLVNYEERALEIDSGSSQEVNPPSSFDPALFLDDTVDFMSMMGPQQVVVNEESIPDFGENDDVWSDRVLSQVLDMENVLQQQQQQQQVQQAPSTLSSS